MNLSEKNCNFTSYKVRKLRKNETIKSFDCGDADLNDFIINEAHHYRKALLAVTYIFEDKETGNVIGYFSLANDRVSLTDFNNKTEFNRFRKTRFVNEKRIKSYPAVKICRLGIDKSLRSKGIGSTLLDFIKYFFIENNKTGCRFLTVDAYNNAISFYKNNKFQHLKEQEDDKTTRFLYFDLNDIY